MKASFLFVFLFAILPKNKLLAQVFDTRGCDSTQVLISSYSGKVTMMLPGCFSKAGKDVIDRKYPGKRKPQEVYGVKELAYIVSVAFFIMDVPTKTEDLPEVRTAYLKSLSSAGFELVTSRIENVSGKDYVVIEYNAEREGHDEIYNILYLSDLDGKLMNVSFNCNDLLRDKWEKIGRDILASLKVK